VDSFKQTIALSLLMLAGCRQVVGIEERYVSDAGAPISACGLPTRGPDCASCLDEHCCQPSLTCAGDMACLKNERCLQACPDGDSACQLVCSNAWQAVDDSESALRVCQDQACSDACGPWNCLGKVTWKLPVQLPDSLKITATTKCTSCGMTGEPTSLGNVQVSVCSMADTDCKLPLVTGATTQDGAIELTVSGLTKPLAVFLQFHKQEWLDDLVLLNTPPLSFDFDVGDVYMDQQPGLDRLAEGFQTSYDPNLAVVKLRIGDCNLRPSTRIDLAWADPGQATIQESFDKNEWDEIAVNVPVPSTRSTRVVAHLRAAAMPGSLDVQVEPIVAVVNLIVREGAVTLAPFVAPTPTLSP
jgi:hypothetical protein